MYILHNLKLNKSIKTFAEGTSMHGFRELYYAKNIFFVIIWILLLTTAVGFTIYQTHRAVNQFVANPTSTTINIPDKSQFLLSPMTACYPHWIYWVDWEKGYSLNFTKASLLYGLSYLSDVYTSTSFDVDEARVQFMESMKSNGFKYMHEFYVAIAKKFPLVGSNGHILAGTEYFTNVQVLFKNKNSLLCYTTSGEQIVRGVEEKWLSQIDNNWNIYVFNFSVQDQKYETLRDYMTLEEYGHYMAVWMVLHSTYWINVNHLRMNFSSFTLPMYFYPDGFSENTVQIDYEVEQYKINIGVSVRKWKQTSQYNCYVDERVVINNMSCYETCRAKYFSKTCDCPRLSQNVMVKEDTMDKLCAKKIFFLPLNETNNISIHDRNGNNRSDIISTKDFHTKSQFQCRQDSFFKDEFQSCILPCNIRPCEEWSYVISTSTSTIDSFAMRHLYKNLTEIIIEFTNPDNVVIMVETSSMSWEDFIGNVGGLLGVWTGASFVSFFQIFYLCCCSDLTCSKKGKKIKQEPRISSEKFSVRSFMKKSRTGRSVSAPPVKHFPVS